MAKIVQRRRGTTAEHSSFTGLEGEITVNTSLNTVVVHDGATAGGFSLALADGSNLTGSSTNSIGISELNVVDGTAGQVLSTDGSGNLSFISTPDVSGSNVGGDLSGTIGNAQIATNTVGITELNVADGTNGQILSTNGSGVLSFVDRPAGGISLALAIAVS